MATLLLAAAGCSSGGGSDRTEKHTLAKRVGSTGLSSTSTNKYVHDTGKSMIRDVYNAKQATVSKARAQHDQAVTRGALLKAPIATTADAQRGTKYIQNRGKSLVQQANKTTQNAQKVAQARRQGLLRLDQSPGS